MQAAIIRFFAVANIAPPLFAHRPHLCPPRQSFMVAERFALQCASWLSAGNGHLQKSAIIVGAGVIGISSAYALTRRGWRVTLVDRASGPAMETSHANGAQLSYCYTDALGSPAILTSLPEILAGKGGVSIRPYGGPQYLFWLTQFARNCTSSKFRQNTLDVLELAKQSRCAMDDLQERHELLFDHRVAGKVQLLYSKNDHRRAKRVSAFKRSVGCEQLILGRNELANLDPALGVLDCAVSGAISTPSEVVADPFLFSRELLQILVRDYGAEAHFGRSVMHLDEAKGRAHVALDDGQDLVADVAIVAAATDSNRLLKLLGHGVAVQPMKGYSFEMPLAKGSPQISVTDSKRRIVFGRLGDRMRVAGIAELGNGSRIIDKQRIDWLINAARECMPQAGDYSQAKSFWTGIRPVTPNSQPVIRRASPTLAINTGHGALGWTLAMGSGERLADILGD
jgi:D-amino-acid dehydrogenase